MKITTAIFAATAVTLAASAHAEQTVDAGAAASTSATASTAHPAALGDIFAKVLWQGDRQPVATARTEPLHSVFVKVLGGTQPATAHSGSDFAAVRGVNPQPATPNARSDLYQIFANQLWNRDRPAATAAKRPQPLDQLFAKVLWGNDRPAATQQPQPLQSTFAKVPREAEQPIAN